jgi:hypothetical protein
MLESVILQFISGVTDGTIQPEPIPSTILTSNPQYLFHLYLFSVGAIQFSGNAI